MRDVTDASGNAGGNGDAVACVAAAVEELIGAPWQRCSHCPPMTSLSGMKSE